MTARGKARPKPKPKPELILVSPLGERHIGLEARTVSADHLDVKVWLRLLACSAQIEQEIRTRLRLRFGTTLPRFDYLAQLERHPDGLRMSALSRYMMVTGGNVTGLTDQLVVDGWVERSADPQDGRSWFVRLTALGRREFSVMAAEHEGWLTEMFCGMSALEKKLLYEQLGRFRLHLAQGRSHRIEGPSPSASASASASASSSASPSSAAPAPPPRAPATVPASRSIPTSRKGRPR